MFAVFSIDIRVGNALMCRCCNLFNLSEVTLMVTGKDHEYSPQHIGVIVDNFLIHVTGSLTPSSYGVDHALAWYTNKTCLSCRFVPSCLRLWFSPTVCSVCN